MYITRQTILADFSLSVNCKKERKKTKMPDFSAHFPQEKGAVSKVRGEEKSKTGNVSENEGERRAKSRVFVRKTKLPPQMGRGFFFITMR